MFKRFMNRWMLLEGESGDVPAGGAPAAAPAADAAPAAPADLTPPESMLNDKPADDAKPGDKPADDKPADPPKPDEPITYEAFKTPEGLALDEAKVAEFSKLAAEAKMPQEVAQKFVDLYTAELKQLTEAPMRAWTALQNQWQEEVRNDPVIGGANLDKNLAATKAGLSNLLGEEAKAFFDALNITGAGNNPAILRGLMKAAAPHAPASPVAGSPAKPAKSAGATLYPTMAGLGNGHEG
jgi:hypothetical protein